MSLTSTQNFEDGCKELLQKLGDNAAHTFKGLYKTSDCLEITYKLYVAVPFLFSLLMLADLVGGILARVLAVISLMFSIMLIINQNSFSAITEYRKLANQFKKVYDQLEQKYHRREFAGLDDIYKRLSELMDETSRLPISRMGRWWSKRVINREMDLRWIYEGRHSKGTSA